MVVGKTKCQAARNRVGCGRPYGTSILSSRSFTQDE